MKSAKFAIGQVVTTVGSSKTAGTDFKVFIVSAVHHQTCSPSSCTSPVTYSSEQAPGLQFPENDLSLATWEDIEAWSERIRKQATALLSTMDKVRRAFPPNSRRRIKSSLNSEKTK